VIDAVAAMGNARARLEIAGAGDYRPALERLAASLDLGDRVRFLGRVSEEEKLRLLRRAWALVFASPKEGWGITNLEAAACGTPVVASNSPGIRESVRDGETGYLVPHGDVSAMAGAMDRIAGDPALVGRLGVAARRFAETFTWERAADQTAAHLYRVLAARRPHQ
jgi:glycosyltransferase involved in cell wall biosynthesis